MSCASLYFSYLHILDAQETIAQVNYFFGGGVCLFVFVSGFPFLLLAIWEVLINVAEFIQIEVNCNGTKTEIVVSSQELASLHLQAVAQWLWGVLPNRVDPELKELGEMALDATCLDFLLPRISWQVKGF